MLTHNANKEAIQLLIESTGAKTIHEPTKKKKNQCTAYARARFKRRERERERGPLTQRVRHCNPNRRDCRSGSCSSSVSRLIRFSRTGRGKGWNWTESPLALRRHGKADPPGGLTTILTIPVIVVVVGMLKPADRSPYCCL